MLSWLPRPPGVRGRALITQRVILVVALAVLSVGSNASTPEADPISMYTEQAGGLVLTAEGASHFSRLALDCVHREYPNKLGQTLPSAEFLLPPSRLHPAFYGCYDWHSSVHGHWMLVKLLKEFPQLPERQAILDSLLTS